MARTAKLKTQPQQPQDVWHTVRQVVAFALFAVVVAVAAYGAWLGLRMYLSQSMPAFAIWQFLCCAVLSGALYTLCVRIEPLPPRRNRRGNRRINIETPTQRQIWETAPGDFIESILTAVGMMAAPAMLLIDFLYFGSNGDFVALMIATAVCAGAFVLEGAFVSWRGRSMWDPPGQVLAPAQEPPKAIAKSDDGLEIGTLDSDADAGGAVADSDEEGLAGLRSRA